MICIVMCSSPWCVAQQASEQAGRSVVSQDLPVFSWAAHNRSVALQAELLHQNYQEQESQGLTSDGTLDTERGNIPGWGLQARWQGPIGFEQFKLPVWIETNWHTYTGRTQYTGYLQTSGMLIPYSAQTGNRIQQWQTKLGIPFTWADASTQLVPYIGWSQFRWHRDLDSYAELYTHSLFMLGVLGQYRIHSDWTAEAELAAGSMRTAHISASGSIAGFDQALGTSTQWQAGGRLQYQLNPQWHLQTQLSYSSWAYGASAWQNNLQEPNSRTGQWRYGLGLARTY